MTAAEPKFKRLISQLLILCGFLFVSTQLNAQGLDGDGEFLRVEEAYQVLVETSADNKIVMSWTIADGYYLYQDRFHLTARNAETSHKIPLTFAQGKRKYDEYFDKELTVYYYNTQVDAELPTISPPFELIVGSMGCADAGLCYPPRKQYFQVDADGNILETEESQFDPSAAVEADETPEDNLSETTPEPSTSAAADSGSVMTSSFLLVLLSALVGGMILNLMPCVFPVLSLKALSFASSHMNKHSQHLHGWAYTGGVIGSFLIVGIIILAGRELGEMLGWGGIGGDGADPGWGFQMQIPGFIIFMIFLFYLMGLSLAGMFHIGTRWMGVGQELTSGHGYRASVFTGILAALVASPCTAPLMAPALGAALLLPTFLALLIFVFLGFGMALPFLILSYNPKLAEKLPAPGQWMETLKQFMAFPMFATCIWLLWVLGHQTSSDGAALIILGGLLVTFAIWLHNLEKKPGILKHIIRLVMLASIVAALAAAYTTSKLSPASSNKIHTSQDTWIPYSPEKLAELRANRIPVFIDLTADWCITCKFNERVALTTEVENRAQALGVTLMVGDWTNSDPDISALLKKYNRSGVPLYLMYSSNPDKDAEILPQILRESIVLEAMEKAL